ncbi:MAG: hypothetical protein J6V71_01765 [Clostridia bacterium]|nr:hypothetical protein [Clostridia bacterium]
MEKDFRYVELFELYQGLLTDRQRQIFSSHYCYDLSLSEIAEPDGNTRQSVYAVVKNVKAKLDEYEREIGLYKKNQKLIELANEVGLNQELAQKILEIVGK